MKTEIDYCGKEVAETLAKKGFKYFTVDKLYRGNGWPEMYLTCPQVSALKWLRDVHHIHVIVKPCKKMFVAPESKPLVFYQIDIYSECPETKSVNKELIADGVFEKYEDALDDGILQALCFIADVKKTES